MIIAETFRAEAERLVEVLSGLDEVQFDRPTGSPPWRVRDLLAHVRTGAGRLVGMLAEPAPPRAEVNAVGYFGPAKFTPDVDSARVDAAQREAAELSTGRALVEELDRSWRATYAAVSATPPDRVVRTRHGDPMTVEDFLVTRVVELGVHGLDLASALGRRPWLTDPAATVIADLLTGPVGSGGGGLATELGWDRPTLITKATGRVPLTDAERVEVDRRDVRWPSFG